MRVSAEGAITFYRWFKTATYVQTSNIQPVAPHYFGDVGVVFDNPLDLTGGTVTSSSSFSPMQLTKTSVTDANYQMSFTFLAGYFLSRLLVPPTRLPLGLHPSYLFLPYA